MGRRTKGEKKRTSLVRKKMRNCFCFSPQPPSLFSCRRMTPAHLGCELSSLLGSSMHTVLCSLPLNITFVYFYHYWNGADCCYLVDRVNAFSDITGETYSLSSIIRFEQPEYKKNHGFALKNGSSSLTMSNAVYVRVASHFTSIGGLFRGMRALTEIEFAPNANITSVGDKTFVDCASLEIIRLLLQ